MTMPDTEYLTPAEVAQRLRVSVYTAREWCKRGVIPATKAPGGKGWLVRADEIDKLMNGEAMSNRKGL